MLLLRNLLKCFVAVFVLSCSDLAPLYFQDEGAQQQISNIDILPISGRYGVYLKNELITESYYNKCLDVLIKREKL